jgi:hypothetical protein
VTCPPKLSLLFLARKINSQKKNRKLTLIITVSFLHPTFLGGDEVTPSLIIIGEIVLLVGGGSKGIPYLIVPGGN